MNILSVLSWFAAEGTGTYSVAKAAEWNMTNDLRIELAGQKTLVQAVHLRAADTDMMADYDVPKIALPDLARASLDGVRAGAIEVLVDDASRSVKASLSAERWPGPVDRGLPGNRRRRERRTPRRWGVR